MKPYALPKGAESCRFQTGGEGRLSSAIGAREADDESCRPRDTSSRPHRRIGHAARYPRSGSPLPGYGFVNAQEQLCQAAAARQFRGKRRAEGAELRL